MRLYVEQYRLIQTLCRGTGVTDVTDITDIMDVTDITDITDVTDVMDIVDVTDIKQPERSGPIGGHFMLNLMLNLKPDWKQ